MRDLFCTKRVHNRRGFTLVEMIIAVAIVALIGSAISTVIIQTISISAANSHRMAAIKQVENALHWIDRDAQQAWAREDKLPLQPSWSYDHLGTLYWIDNTELPVHEHSVTYTLNGTDLYRADSITLENSLIATDISEVKWSFIKNPESKYLLTVNITSSVEGYKPATESRTLLVMPRVSR
jgi:prepilin-type N-terminal cleavage/methylation domain-containing protein